MPDIEDVLNRLRSQIEDEPGEHDEAGVMVRASDVRAVIAALEDAWAVNMTRRA